MFDLNLLAKPGLQPQKVNTSISFLEEKSNVKKMQKDIPEKKTNQKSRTKLLLILGLLITAISAVGFLYILPLLNSNNMPIKPDYKFEISQNEVVSGLIDILLNEEMSPHISKIEFKRDELLIQFKTENELIIQKLLNNDFYGINIRTKINSFLDKIYLYKIPWEGVTIPNSIGMQQIKENIGERFVLSNNYDFASNSIVLTINEFKNLVSIILRLNDSNLLQNFEILIVPGKDDFTTISLKNF